MSKEAGTGGSASRGHGRLRTKNRVSGRREESSSAQISIVEGDASSDSSEGGEPWNFRPSVKVKENGENSILITTVVCKGSSLTSSLFAILEEERLDIMSESQYRTETKVSHTILVNNLPPGYDTEALKRKLFEWAGIT